MISSGPVANVIGSQPSQPELLMGRFIILFLVKGYTKFTTSMCIAFAFTCIILVVTGCLPPCDGSACSSMPDSAGPVVLNLTRS